jgi:hypothetical protein
VALVPRRADAPARGGGIGESVGRYATDGDGNVTAVLDDR